MNRLTKYALRGLGLLFILFLLLYAGDYLSVRIRLRHPTHDDPLESMTRTRILAIPEKNGRTDFEVDAQKPVETLTCVHSFFPHLGYSPCWRIKPHFNDPIPMQFLPPAFRIPASRRNTSPASAPTA